MSPATIKKIVIGEGFRRIGMDEGWRLAMREARWARIVDWKRCSSAAIDKKHSQGSIKVYRNVQNTFKTKVNEFEYLR